MPINIRNYQYSRSHPIRKSSLLTIINKNLHARLIGMETVHLPQINRKCSRRDSLVKKLQLSFFLISNINMRKFHSLLLLFIFLLPLPVFAHGGHGTGFMAGLTHPIFGIDHLVAIFAIAIFGATSLKEKNWLPSLSFIIAMVIGGLLGIQAEAFSITEYIIVFSVLITGFFLAFEARLTPMIYIPLFALFGFFHGHAHGTEMPEASNIPLYILGFITGVGVLSCIGFRLPNFFQNSIYLRLSGAFIAGMGLMMILG